MSQLITPEEAVQLTKKCVTLSELDYVWSIEEAWIDNPDFEEPWNYLSKLACVWNAGRTQGIREERQRRKLKKYDKFADQFNTFVENTKLSTTQILRLRKLLDCYSTIQGEA